MTELDTRELPALPGTYVLVFACDQPAVVTVGRLGEVELMPGFYLYAGSAFGPEGLGARIGRHARRDKACHWHLDYLRPCLRLEQAWYATGRHRREHHWAGRLAARPGLEGIRGLGSSDCACDSHFFQADRLPETGVLGCQALVVVRD